MYRRAGGRNSAFEGVVLNWGFLVQEKITKMKCMEKWSIIKRVMRKEAVKTVNRQLTSEPRSRILGHIKFCSDSNRKLGDLNLEKELPTNLGLGSLH